MRIRRLFIFFFLSMVLLSQLRSISPMLKRLPKECKEWILGDIDKSLESLLESSNKNEIVNYNIAYIYYLQNNYPKSLEYISKSLHENDDYEWAFYLRGLIAVKRDNTSKAISFFEQAIDNEDQYEFFFELAKIYDEENNFELANEYYEKAVSENASLMSAHIRISEFISKRNIEDAIEYLEEALEDQYPSDNYYLLLGDLYKKIGRKVKAVKNYNNYLKYYPNGHYQKEIKERLESLNITNFPPIFDPSILTKKFKMRPNEYLKYQVSYGFNLGKMFVQVADSIIEYEGKKLLKVNYELKSTSFLLSLDAFFETYLNVDNLSMEYSFLSRMVGDKAEVKFYELNRIENVFKARIVLSDGRFEYVEKELPHNAQGGTAILFYTRGLVASRISQRVTTVINENFKWTDVFFHEEERKEEVFDKDQVFFYLSAKAHYQGVAGTTGAAEGFFLKENVVPAIGKMRIIVGKVRIELVEMN